MMQFPLASRIRIVALQSFSLLKSYTGSSELEVLQKYGRPELELL